MGQLQKFTKLLLKQSQSNFGYVSIPKDPNIVLNYEKAKYCDVTFRDKSGLDEQKSRSKLEWHDFQKVLRNGCKMFWWYLWVPKVVTQSLSARA